MSRLPTPGLVFPRGHVDPPKTSHAITILEVLVAIAIIGLLIVLSLPAIQAAREAMRRAECSSKLRQIGMALHNYASDYGVFPLREMFSAPAAPRDHPGIWSVHVTLLPYLEQRELYDSLNFVLQYQHRANRTTTRAVVEIYVCPSDLRPRGGRNDASHTNYVGSDGSGRWPHGFDAPCDGNARTDGFFGAGILPPGRFTDGLAHTAAFCEQVHGERLDPSMGHIHHPAPGYEYLFPNVSPPTQRQLMSLCENVSSLRGLMPDQLGVPWLSPRVATYTHLFSPNKTSCFGGNLCRAFSPITASSRHRGGVNLLSADGSVRFVSAAINTETWRALGSRDGTELVGDF